MKIICLSLFLFSLLQNMSAQVTGKLSLANGQPVSFATVLLLKNQDSSLVKAGMSDEDGAFRLEGIVAGNYLLRISATGYQSWQSPVFELTALQNSKNFGTVVMKENAKELGEVIVRAEKPLYQQKPEGTIIHVENSLMTKGSTALQVLERSPGVVINHRDNSIELNGKSGVMVMLNGKLIRMSMEQVVNLLSGMSADNIATIELLTTPPANYDAEGSAGLINIVLKKNRKSGTNGSVSLTAGYGYREKGTAGIQLSHNKGKLNVFGSYTISHNNTYSDMLVTSSQYMAFMGGDVFVEGRFTTKAKRNSQDASLGADIKLNSKTTLGANLAYNSSRMFSTNFTDAGYNVLPDSLLQFTGDNRGANRWNNLVSSINLEKIFRREQKINIDLDYLYFTNRGNTDVQSSFLNKQGMQAGTDELLFSPRQKGNAKTRIQVGVAKLDYTKQLNKSNKLDAGIKFTSTKSSGISGIESLLNGAWTSSEETSSDIIMNENTGAAYISFNLSASESASLVGGLRYEYSYTNMDNAKSGTNIANRKLGSLFPSLFFSKKINDDNELQLSYTKRISRPSYNDLASYVGYSDPTAVYTGNPFLKPTITHNLKIGYNYKRYSFSVLFSRDLDAITRYQLSESPDTAMLYISPQNLDWQNNLTVQANLPFKIKDWWNMNYSFVGGLRHYKATYTKQPFEKSYIGFSFNFSQVFRLGTGVSAELSGIYNSQSFDGTRRVAGYGVVNAGIKKELKKNRGSLQLSIADIFRRERYLINYGSVTEEAFQIRSYVAFYPESAKSPILRFTYARSFGSGILKSQKKEGNSAKDERDRISTQ